MDSKFFTPTFTRFFFGFICILCAAFGVMLWAANEQGVEPAPIDNVAMPQ